MMKKIISSKIYYYFLHLIDVLVVAYIRDKRLKKDNCFMGI